MVWNDIFGMPCDYFVFDEMGRLGAFMNSILSTWLMMASRSGHFNWRLGTRNWDCTRSQDGDVYFVSIYFTGCHLNLTIIIQSKPIFSCYIALPTISEMSYHHCLHTQWPEASQICGQGWMILSFSSRFFLSSRQTSESAHPAISQS